MNARYIFNNIYRVSRTRTNICIAVYAVSALAGAWGVQNIVI